MSMQIVSSLFTDLIHIAHLLLTAAKNMSSNMLLCVHVSLSVPEQAGGAAEADERSAHQNVRTAGRGGARPGDDQSQARAGKPHGPGQDPEVREREARICTHLTRITIPMNRTEHIVIVLKKSFLYI